MPASSPHRVVIAGGGVAAVETVFALADLIGPEVELVVLAPHDEFVLRAQSLGRPWGRPPLSISLQRLCDQHGAQLRRTSLREVRPGERVAVIADGSLCPYDELVVAVGARPSLAYVGVHTVGFGPLPRALAEATHGTVAIVVPPGCGWTLPAYELALLTASTHPGAVTVYTPEPAPLALFGDAAATAAARFLAERHVTVRTGWTASPGAFDAATLADTVLALPRHSGPQLRGLPVDRAGFIEVDAQMRVTGLPHVYAAGDAIVGAIKQGGLAAQQAEVLARDIAHGIGGRLAPVLYRPVLRGVLTAPDGATLYLRRALEDPSDAGRASADPLWRPETAVVAMRLMRWLASRPREFGEPPGSISAHLAERGNRTLASGRRVHLKVTHASDDGALAGLLEHLSPDGLSQRFFTGAVDTTRAAHLASDEPHGVWGLLAYDENDAAVGHVMLAPTGPAEAEVAFAVVENRQGEGLATLLLQEVAVEARRREITRLTAVVLAENTQMLDVFRHAFACSERHEGDEITLSMALEAVRPAGPLGVSAASG